MEKMFQMSLTQKDGFTVCAVIKFELFSIHRTLLGQITVMLSHPQVPLLKYIQPLTQYGIKHFRVDPGRSAKCYVNPLNDLFKLLTITIQR